MGKYKIVNLDNYYNNCGFTKKEEINRGNLTFNGTSFPLEDDFENFPNYKEVPLKFSKYNGNDNIELEGQTIHLDGEYTVKKIYIVGLSVYGDYFDELYLHKGEKLVETTKLKLTCTSSNSPCFENKELLKYDSLNNIKKGVLNIPSKIWLDEIELTQPTVIDSIKFEDNPFMHVFSITLEIV
ncbi:hypothetical protein CN679_25005 [Bacillus pseudomycoides]|uniref:hypothetical protein n=1 Tax=Bacillus pseudomycoides TaxID=64104 RepID=UPI000BF21FF1|nr:hypothetical protein [Bacillus pseudomycoides]PEI85156.1 hypothetical protein CN679_25005 [Bacillus pseudomycoides]